MISRVRKTADVLFDGTSYFRGTQSGKSALTLLFANVETVPSMRRHSYPKASELSYSTKAYCKMCSVFPSETLWTYSYPKASELSYSITPFCPLLPVYPSCLYRPISETSWTHLYQKASELSHSIRAVIAKSALLFPVYFPCPFPVCRPCRYRRTPNTPQNQKVLICTRNTISDPCRSRYQEPGDNSMPLVRRPKKPCLCSRSAL